MTRVEDIRRPVRPRARQRAPRIGLFGILCSGNLGNDASLDAVMNALRARHPDAEFDFLCMGPEEATARYGTPATSLQWYEAHAGSATGARAVLLKVVGKLLDPFRTLAWVRRQDVVVVPGMGALETTTPVRFWAFPLSLYVLCVGARMFRTKVALISVGANVIRQRLTRLLFTSAVRLVHYRSFRDNVSYDAMREMGVDVSADRVYPDVAFSLPVPPAGDASSGWVGVGLMAFYGGNDDRRRAGDLYGGYLSTIKGFLRWLTDRGHRVRLFVGDPEDAETLADVIAEAREHAPGAVIAEPAKDFDELLRQMATVDTVVATRYHNVIGGLMLAKPTLSIGYAAKHAALMEGMGVGDYCVPARGIDLEGLTTAFTALERYRAEVTATLRERNAAARRELDAQFELVSSTLFAATRARF